MSSNFHFCIPLLGPLQHTLIINFGFSLVGLIPRPQGGGGDGLGMRLLFGENGGLVSHPHSLNSFLFTITASVPLHVYIC